MEDIMTYTTKYNKNDGGYLTDYSGTVANDDIFSSAEEHLAFLKNENQVKYFLSDFSAVDDFKVTPDAVIKLADIAAKASKINDEIMLVAIVPTDLMYGTGRMWQSYSNEANLKTYMARTRHDAEAWLKEHSTIENIIY